MARGQKKNKQKKKGRGKGASNKGTVTKKVNSNNDNGTLDNAASPQADIMDQLPAGSMDMLTGLLGGSNGDNSESGNMFADAAARTAQSLGPAHKYFAPLDDDGMDRLWERLNSEEALNDEDFEIWPDLADIKIKKRAEESTDDREKEKAQIEEPLVTVQDVSDTERETDREEFILDYDSDEELRLDDILYPHTPMPAVSERSMDDVLGTPATDDGTPSLLARMLDPDSGGKGANKNGLRGLLPQKKKPEMTPRQKLKERMRAKARLRHGLSKSDYVYDARGRRVRGARQISMEDVQNGNVPRSMLQNVDKKAMREQIKQNIAKERAKIAAAQKEKESVQNLSIAAATDGED